MLSADFPDASAVHGFQYKYGTIPTRTDFFNYATINTCDPLTFTQGSTAWRSVPRMGWVESPNDDPSSTLNAEFSTNFTLTETTEISFDWQVNSEENIGVLSFYVDGTIVKSITGETEFETVRQSLGEGNHTLKWVYKRTTSENSGLGIGRVKNLNVQNTTVGAWIDAPATSSSLLLEHLYPSQDYIFRAYSSSGGEMVYSTIQPFKTKSISLGNPTVVNTTQTTATFECDVNPGDAEVQAGFIFNSVATPTNTFASYFYAASSQYKPTPSWDSKWGYSTSGYVYNNNRSNNQDITISFTLDHPAQISFEYKVSGGRINYVEDGTTIQCTSSSYTTVTRTLAAGTHTIKWITYFNSNIYAYTAFIKNVQISSKDDVAEVPVVIADGKISYTLTNLKPDAMGTVQSFLRPAYSSPLEYTWPVGNSDAVFFTTKPVTTQTDSVTNRRQASARLYGSFDCGDATLVAKGIQYKNATTTRWSKATTTEEGNKLIANVTSLLPATKYEWRTFIQAEGCDTVFSQKAEFTTDTVRALKPTLVSCTQHTAKVQGEVIVGDATIYARGMEFRAVGSSEWESVEDLGMDDMYVIEKNDLALHTAYQARTYVQQAGNQFVYSDVLEFTTKNIEAFVDSVTNVYQRTAVIHGRVSPGDDNVESKKIHIYKISGSSLSEVATSDITTADTIFAHKITGLQPETRYAFIVEARNSEGASVFSGTTTGISSATSTTDAFTKALLSPLSATNVTVTHDDTWKAGSGYVYMNTNSDGKVVTATFTLLKAAAITFDWRVKGLGSSSSNQARIDFFVDGASSASSQIKSSSNSSYTSGSVTQSLSAGKHTLKWSSYYYGTYDARISNLLIPVEAVEVESTGQTGAYGTCTTLGFFESDSFVAKDITQTTATLHATTIPTDEEGVDYIVYRYNDVSDTELRTIWDAMSDAEKEPYTYMVEEDIYYDYEVWAADYRESLRVLYPTTIEDNKITSALTELTHNTNYVFYLAAITADGTTFKNRKSVSFTTLPVGLNITMSSVTQTSAVAKVTVNAGTAAITNLQYYFLDETLHPVSGNINLTGLKPNTTYSIGFRYTVDGGVQTYNYSFTTLATSVSLSSSEVLQTSAMVRLDASVGTATYVTSGYMFNGENITLSSGSSRRLTELTPNTEYTIQPYVTTTEGGTVYGKAISFRTKSITLTTTEPTNISNRSATLNGTIDCDSYSSAEFGMQWREKTGWTTDPRFTVGHKNDDGTITLALVNGMLKPDTEYEFRTAVRYKDVIYYASSWKDLRTELEFVVYPATPYTLYRTDSENNRLILCGYYIAGSEDVVSQGYEYWLNGGSAKSRLTSESYQSGNQVTATAKQVVLTDTSMEGFIDLSALDHGTYSIRAFVTTTSSTYYGQQLTFTVGEPLAVEEVDGDNPTCIVSDSQIVIKNAVGTHVRIIDMSGRIVYGNRLSKAVETISVYPGVYIVKLGSSKTLKVAVK